MTQRTIVIVVTGLLLAGCEPEGKPSSSPPLPAPLPKTPATATASAVAPAAAPAPAQSALVAPASAAPKAGGAQPPTGTAGGATAKSGAAVKTPSGLEYTVLKEGAGAMPALGSMVKVQTTGWLPGGKTFMDTRSTGIPKEYKLDSLEMIPGWVEALQTMRSGEKRKIHVPSGLAYGVRGSPEVVPPRTDVDFEIELVSFTPPGAK